jgi:hypothetical protein
VPLQIDGTAPDVAVSAPADGATFARGQTVAAAFTCADAAGGSGIAECSGTEPAGQPIDTAAPGAHTFTVGARDVAGNDTTRTVHYTVTDNTALAGSVASSFTRPPFDRVQSREDVTTKAADDALPEEVAKRAIEIARYLTEDRRGTAVAARGATRYLVDDDCVHMEGPELPGVRRGSGRYRQSPSPGLSSAADVTPT